MAEANLYVGRESSLSGEMRTYIAERYDDWKAEKGGFFKSIRGAYPTGQEVIENIDVTIKQLNETIMIPAQSHILGIGSYLKKEVDGKEKFYKVTETKLEAHDPEKLDILYTFKRQVKIYGQYQDDITVVENSILASDLGKSYKVQFPVPYSPQIKQSRKQILRNLVSS